MMVNKRKDISGQLENFADSLVEDILNASDSEILHEANEDCGDPRQLANNTREIFEKARSIIGKKRLVEARDELEKKQSTDKKIIRLDPSEARRRLTQIMENNPEVATELTLAARKESELSDDDVIGMLEDLEELGFSPYLDNDHDSV